MNDTTTKDFLQFYTRRWNCESFPPRTICIFKQINIDINIHHIYYLSVTVTERNMYQTLNIMMHIFDITVNCKTIHKAIKIKEIR